MAKAPGKSYRKGITLVDVLQQFDTEEKANEWFVARRWPDGLHCAYCYGTEVRRRETDRKTPQYRCNECRRNFTVKTGTIMQDSKLPLSKWALAFYLYNTHLKGVSSMKLHRDLGVTQKTAWHLAMRIRETFDRQMGKFIGPVQTDEVYLGGKEGNKHRNKRIPNGRFDGKTMVAGMLDEHTGQIELKVIENKDAGPLQQFIYRHTQRGATVYTDESKSYSNLKRRHETVNHSAGEYVNGQATTNGIESFWALLKRGYTGTYHKMSTKHLPRYITEFKGRHNTRRLDTEQQMDAMVRGSIGKRLRYADLKADPST